MSALPWILLAVLALVVGWVVMRQNDVMPAPYSSTANGQPLPPPNYGNPQAAGADAGLATAITNAVGAAFGLAGSIVNASNNKR